jgi:RNA polymerase sigma-70 factor, ECF subfamily
MLTKEHPLEAKPKSVAHRPESDTGRVDGHRPAFTDEPTAPDRTLEAGLNAARRGNEEGFALLWRALHPPLVRYLTARGDEAPEDVAAETWLHVIKGLSGFVGGVPQFRAWLFTMARNRAIDQARMRRARPALSLTDPHNLKSPFVEPSAEDTVAGLSSTDEAIRLVCTLPQDQAEMVMLRVVAGLEVATVAALVGKSPGAVRVAVHRALKSLAAHPQVQAQKGEGA